MIFSSLIPVLHILCLLDALHHESLFCTAEIEVHHENGILLKSVNYDNSEGILHIWLMPEKNFAMKNFALEMGGIRYYCEEENNYFACSNVTRSNKGIMLNYNKLALIKHEIKEPSFYKPEFYREDISIVAEDDGEEVVLLNGVLKMDCSKRALWGKLLEASWSLFVGAIYFIGNLA